MVGGVLEEVAAAEQSIDYRRGMIWISAQGPGGQTMRLIVDTGAEESVLDVDAARKLGVGVRSQETIRGVGGLAQAYRSETCQLSCAGYSLRKSFLMVDLGAASRKAGRQVDGLLGADFFQGKTVRIDYRNKRLCVNPSSYGGAGSQTLRISRHYGAICVPLTVGDTYLPKVRLDTGCVSALHWSAPGAGTGRAVRGESSIGFASGNQRNSRSEVTLGHMSMGRVSTQYHSRRLFPGEDGLLGNGLLDQFCITIDLRSNRLVLDPY